MCTRTKRNLFNLLATLTLAAAPAFAAPIFVNNYSFETLPVGGLTNPCGAGCSYSVIAIPDWSNAGGSSGQFQPGTTPNQYFDTLSDGPTHAFSNSETISQVVGETVQLGAVYTFLVDIGYRLDDGVAFAGTADLFINGNTYMATGVQPVRGTFGTFTAMYTGLLADVGKSITLELHSTGAQGNFDNVRLDAVTATPEPASFLLIGSALLAVSKIQRRRAKSKTQI